MTRRPRGLRARSALAFAGLAMVLSAVLSVSTYQLARWQFLDQRETLGLRQATLNASVIKGLLASSESDPVNAITSIASGTGSRGVLRFEGSWYAAVVDLNETKIPAELISNVEEGIASRQRIKVNGTPYLVVGVAVPGVDAAYFEFVGLREYQRTLETLLIVLIVGASVTTIGGAFAGWLISRRVLRPLSNVANAARSMSEGDLSSRLVVTNDPDLEPVAQSFNEMAQSLEDRIAREIRFTADVSHELRTPLTAVGAAVNLAQRSELPERATFAIDMVAAQVDQLNQLTLELLEISRFDAGVADLNVEPTDVLALTRRVVDGVGGASPPTVIDHLGDEPLHSVDRVRFERVVVNLVENAARYGGGATEVTLGRDAQHGLVLTVDDAGPGIPEDERVAIFGRFHRGTAQKAPGAPKGTGLGLSLVEEHTALHGGSVTVAESPSGGARFVAVFP